MMNNSVLSLLAMTSDNVNKMMLQFEGRAELLIATLQAMEGRNSTSCHP